ncbi:hypothetical protein C8R44DRAFT_727676 [Mycena epipterygia]|nr:hypothetical protein C8R44DRAFT_727676 [Mycena epipterygia]
MTTPAPDPNKWRARETFSSSSNLPPGSRIRMMFPIDLRTATHRPSSVISHTSAASTSALEKTLKMRPVLLLNYRFGVVKGKEVVEVLALSEVTFENTSLETYLGEVPASVFRDQGASLIGDLLLPVFCTETAGLPQHWEQTMRRLPQIAYSTVNNIDFPLPGRVWMVRFVRQIRFPATLAFYQQPEANANLIADHRTIGNVITYSFNGAEMVSTFSGGSGSGLGGGTAGAGTGEGPDKRDGAGQGGTKEEDGDAEGGGGGEEGEEEGAGGASSSAGGNGTGGQVLTRGASFGAWMFPNNIPADLILPVVDITGYSSEDAEEEDGVEETSVYSVFKDSTSPLYIRSASPLPPHPTSEASLPSNRRAVHSAKSVIKLDKPGEERNYHRSASEKTADYTLVMVSQRPTRLDAELVWDDDPLVPLPSMPPLVLRTVTVAPMVQSLLVLTGKSDHFQGHVELLIKGL